MPVTNPQCRWAPNSPFIKNQSMQLHLGKIQSPSLSHESFSEKGVLAMPFWFPPLASLQQTRMLIGKARLIKTREANETVGGVEGGEGKKVKFKHIIKNISALLFLGGIS